MAVDLNTQRPVWPPHPGAAREQGPFGIASMLEATVGTPNNGGSAVAWGDVAFTVATLDRRLRAFDTGTGGLLWAGREGRSGAAA